MTQLSVPWLVENTCSFHELVLRAFDDEEDESGKDYIVATVTMVITSAADSETDVPSDSQIRHSSRQQHFASSDSPTREDEYSDFSGLRFGADCELASMAGGA